MDKALQSAVYEYLRKNNFIDTLTAFKREKVK